MWGRCLGSWGSFTSLWVRIFEDKRPRDRYAAQSKGLLGVLNQHLVTHIWMAGDDYAITAMAMFPWVRNLVGFYDAAALVQFDNFPHVRRAGLRHLWHGQQRCAG